MSGILSAPLNSIKNILVSFFTVITFPIQIVFVLLMYIYKIIFSLQFFMANTCISLFGEGYGCDILNPNYVFSTVIFSTIKILIITYTSMSIYKYINKK